MQDRYINADIVCKRIRNYFKRLLENAKEVDIADVNADIMKVIDKEPSVLFWQDAELFMPKENELCLIIVSGKYKNIKFKNALQLGWWNKDEGWIVEGFPEFENPLVKYWCDAPEVPEDVRERL